jgi:lysophospholipase L1-like esterase
VANDCPGAFVFLSNLYDRRYYAASNDRKPVGAASFLGRTDGFHPNAQGHRDIAAAILQAIRIR